MLPMSPWPFRSTFDFIQVGFDMRSSTSAADDNVTIADTQALDEMLERSELGSVMGSDTYSMPGSLHVRKELDRGVTPGGSLHIYCSHRCIQPTNPPKKRTQTVDFQQRWNVTR